MNPTFDPNIPIYMQIIDKLTKEIILGNTPPGEKLLSIRELAKNYTVNPNTVQRALADLERTGLITSQRSDGKYVTLDNELVFSIKNDICKKNTQDYIFSMKQLGYSNLQIIDFLQNNLENGDENNA